MTRNLTQRRAEEHLRECERNDLNALRRYFTLQIARMFSRDKQKATYTPKGIPHDHHSRFRTPERHPPL